MNAFLRFPGYRLAALLLFGVVSNASSQIVSHPPQGLIGTTGGGITISASAPAAASFQWEKSTDGGNNYTAVTGSPTATTASLVLTNLQASDAARYRLVTPGGTSSATVLTVATAAQLTPTPQLNVAFRSPTRSTTGVTGAGAIGSAASVWNNLTGATLSNTLKTQDLLSNAPLASDTGAATSVTLTLTASSPTNTIDGVVKAWENGASFSPSPIVRYYTYYWWNATLTLGIKGLRPGTSYNLYGYGAGDAHGQGSQWTLAAANGGASASVLADYNNGYTRDVTNPANLGHSYIKLTGAADASGTMTVVVDNVAGSNDPFFSGFQIAEAAQTTLTTQPVDTATTEGDSAVIFASAPTATAFMWQRSTDGGATYSSLDVSSNPSAATAQLTLSNAQAGDSGFYRLIVIDPTGSVIVSSAALLSVVPDAGSSPDEGVNVAVRAASQSGAAAVTGAAVAGTSSSVWNNVVGATPSSTDLVQTLVSDAPLISDSGAASGKTLKVVAATTQYNVATALKVGNDNASFSPVSGILRYYSYIWWPGGYTVTIAGLRAKGLYELYGYGSGSSSGNGSKWTFGGSSADVLADFSNGYTRDVSCTSNLGHSYVKLTGNASEAGVVTFTVKAPSTGGDPFFNGFQLIPVALPAITAQPPASSTATLDGGFSLGVVAIGSGSLSYQWQKSTDDGTTFANINPALNASSATANLYIASVQSSDAGIYRAIISNASGAVVSDATTVTTSNELVAPSIAGHPSATAVLYGEDATFTVAASGSSPLSYQWQRSTDGGLNYVNVGTDSFSLTVAGAGFADVGLYRVVVTNALGSATSDPATLTVNRAPVITAQPVGGVFASGSNQTLSVGVSAYPEPAYELQRSTDGIAFTTVGTGATLPLTLSGATTGIYRVVLTNAIGTVTSDKLFLGIPTAQAFTLFPGPGITGVNPDAPLVVRFPAAPRVGTVGKITVRKTSDGSVVETIDLGALSSLANGSAIYRYQSKNIGGAGGGTYSYFPVVIVGNEARITLKSGTVLQYGASYYVNIEPGAILDSTGASFPTIADATTWSFTTKATAPAAVPAQTTFTVAADGSGDFSTLQGALDFIPAGSTTPVRINLRAGIYEEIINYGNRHKITLVGEARDQTIVEYVNNNVLNAGTSGRVSFYAKGNDLALLNLTINNATPKGGSQAEALRSDGARNVFLGCTIKSFQDTLLLGAGNYFKDCLIQGDTDFIWGGGTAMFKGCELRCMNGGDLTQSRAPFNKFGFVFVDCTITRPSGSAFSYSLGRTSADATTYGNPVFIDCKMDAHISASAWSSSFINSAYTANARNWEYHSANLAGTALIDVSQRAAFSRQLTDSEAAILRNAANVFGTTTDSTPAGAQGDGWVPSLVPIILDQPESQTVAIGESVTFSVAVIAAPDPTFQWYRNDAPIDGATGSTYTIASASPEDWGDYHVVVSNSAGTANSSTASLELSNPDVQWAASHGLDPAGNGARGADADSDGVINLVEFAFGMDPTSGRIGPFTMDGSTLTATGMPSVHQNLGFTARFIRRKTHVADGLTYTPQLSASLAGWEDSTATPTVIASDDDHELVEIPYPASVGGLTPRFFRVLVSVAP